MLVDDSIVRGTTSRKIVQMMRDAGASEVHFRIASPPITHPDYYGIDTPERDKLLAATHDLEGMRKFIGADSLAFLSVDGIYRAMGFEGRDPARPQFTDHCFTGDYPTPLTDPRRARGEPTAIMSLLAEAMSARLYCLSRMAQPLTDRIVLVTGASRGIGARLRLSLRSAGAHVVAVARTVGGLEELDDRIKAGGGSATLVPLDVRRQRGHRTARTCPERPLPAARCARRQCWHSRPLSPLAHVEPKDWDNLIAVNVTANWQFIRCMDALLRRSQAGRAVFLTSGVAHVGRALLGPYAASKAALEALVRTYAAECATTPVRVNLFGPAPRARACMRVLSGHRSAHAANARRSCEGDIALVPAGVRRDREAL